MEKKYYSLGQISYRFLAEDMESFNKIMDWREKVGSSALTFIDIDTNMINKVRQIVKSSCNGWDIIVCMLHINEPEPVMVMRGILEDKKFKTIYINIQRDIKQISFYITLCQDSWAFVTTYFIYKIKPYGSDYLSIKKDEFKCWSAFFCDMEYDDSLSSLVSDICKWYEKQNVNR